MKEIGIFYGSTYGTTLGVVEEIEFLLKKEKYKVYNVNEYKDKMKENIKNYENLIFVMPTYGVGELQSHWNKVYEELKEIDFTEKIVGIVGLGNQVTFNESFVGGMRFLYDVIIKNSGKVVGLTDKNTNTNKNTNKNSNKERDKYNFEDTNAIIEDKFVGLPIDEVNQQNLTPIRLSNWIDEIKLNFK